MNKKIKIILAMVVVTILVIGALMYFFVFQSEENQDSAEQEQLITAPLEELALKASDVPENFTYSVNSTYYSEIPTLTEDPNKYFQISFENGEFNETPGFPLNHTTKQLIFLELFSFSTNNTANINYNNLLYISSRVEIINESIDSIGEYSFATIEIGDTYDQDNVSVIMFYFKILNIVGRYYGQNVSYQESYDLVKIVEQRMYDSLN